LKSLSAYFMLVLGFCLIGFSVSKAQTSFPMFVKSDAQAERIVLTENNCVVFRGEVTDDKVGEVEQELQNLSQRLSSTDVIYLVLDTPGGSVDAGNAFITYVHGLPQKVKTISIFAASMGFHIAQNLDERLVVPHGTLMSHRVRASMSGEVPGELISRLNALLKTITRMDTVVANRMKMSVEDYQEMVHDEYWTDGQSAVDEKAADRLVNVACDKSLSGRTKEQVGEFLGIRVLASVSKCPLISGMKDIELEGADGKSSEDKTEALNFSKLLSTDLKTFVHEYVVPGRI
jgi:ATP-dependent Clp protease protease subunit